MVALYVIGQTIIFSLRLHFENNVLIVIIIVIMKTYNAPLTGAQQRRTVQCKFFYGRPME